MLSAPVEIDFDRGDDVVLAEAHDRAFAELLFDLSDGGLDAPSSVLVVHLWACEWGPFGTRMILETRQAKVKRKSVQ